MGVRGGGREIAGCGGGGQRCSRVGEGTAYARGCVCGEARGGVEGGHNSWGRGGIETRLQGHERPGAAVRPTPREPSMQLVSHGDILNSHPELDISLAPG